MKVVDSAKAMQRQSARWVRSGESVGFVPTMGALHEGHLSLIRRARKECQRVVVSIYVNPTQFGPKEDLAKYPRPREKDLALCRRESVDLVFAPENLYEFRHSTFVEETALSLGREGAIRPGHFRGVATVVLKLFNLVRPTRAYFGQKDAQQLDVIEGMVRDLNVPVKIIAVPIVRDHDGLALSSRNVYLSDEERKIGVQFAKLLQHAAKEEFYSEEWLREKLKKLPGLKLDYVEQVRDRLVAAVRVGATRLLDNERIRTIHAPEGFMIQTRSGKNVSVLFAHFKTGRLKPGNHDGIWCITGSPDGPDREVRALLQRLKKFKSSFAGKVPPFCRLIVSEKYREYVIAGEGVPKLRAKVRMKRRGTSYGDLFIDSKLIGRAAVFAEGKQN